ncbi:hypothetical protein PR202_ga15701 [Eleusine coracana subsp. coracana]|uniref:Uncharacterized protein n=1 Tax=Eleusine coracana subsp. coracana TaxID=191504 RepID=A0AAV5CKW1_ELECO|nr:hypothetical protein PR202_ga15701 [Eleusine coracana subsp. coracana]
MQKLADDTSAVAGVGGTRALASWAVDLSEGEKPFLLVQVLLHSAAAAVLRPWGKKFSMPMGPTVNALMGIGDPGQHCLCLRAPRARERSLWTSLVRRCPACSLPLARDFRNANPGKPPRHDRVPTPLGSSPRVLHLLGFPTARSPPGTAAAAPLCR